MSKLDSAAVSVLAQTARLRLVNPSGPLVQEYGLLESCASSKVAALVSHLTCDHARCPCTRSSRWVSGSKRRCSALAGVVS